MKLVVMSRLQPRSVEIFVRGGAVIYRPDLAEMSPPEALEALAVLRPRVLIACEAQAPWLSGVLHGPLAKMRDVIAEKADIVVYGLASTHCASAASASPRRFSHVTAASWAQAEHEAFLLSEALCRPTPAPAVTCAGVGPVTMLGGGVVNLVTALILRERGHAVTIYDRMADPLLSPHDVPADAGASFGGRDARIFSLNESRHHLVDSVVPDQRGELRFRRGVGHDGWLSRAFNTLADDDRRWIRQIETVPPWAALQYGNDIVRFNQESEAAWKRLFALHPELLIEAHYVGPLLRTYPDDAALASAVTAEGEIGAVVARLGAQELAAREPALVDAVARRAIAGALQVCGFSLNLHRFCRNLVRLLQRLGVAFHWRHTLQEIRHDAAGRVERLVIDGRALEVRDGVVSPGAYGHAVRGQSQAAASIGAMVGMWMTLPNDIAPLTSPLKVRRRGFGSAEAAQGANVIPARDASGRPVLHCSSGHGFIGKDPGNVASADLRELARCIEETAEDLFPDKVRRAREVGGSCGAPGFCVRPWTPSGLGIFEAQETAAGGRLVFSGAHNTGGFAQAPAVAEAVARALQGEAHPMHALYHPRRPAEVFGEAA